MKGAIFQSLAAVSLGLPSVAAAEVAGQQATSNAHVRAPSGRWVVDFDDAQCVASRNYGTDREPLILALKAPAAGEVMQVAVSRRGRGGQYAQQLDAEIGIDGRTPVATSILAMTSGGNNRLYRLNLPLDQFNAIREARTLTIRAGREFRETFQLSDMAPLLRVVDECVADLRTVWNVGGGEALASRARGNLHGVIRAEDYPGIAMTEDSEGTVAFVLLIDEAGRVADCTITETSGIAALDAQTCAIIQQRARFEPAVDRGGRPAKDAVHQRVSWRLGG